MKNLQFKVITGFREDQYFTINADELHKAYFIFMNPEVRTVFNNGTALIGKNIQGIEPDYKGSMNWNPTHKLDADDYNDMRGKGILNEFTEVMSLGKEVAEQIGSNPELLRLPLSKIQIAKIENRDVKKLSDGLTNNLSL